MHGRCGKRWYKYALMALVGIAVAGLAVMALWNWLVPALFGLKQIGFLQALGLLVLTRLLFGGLRGRHGMHGPWRRHLEERWMQMTPEEREKFHAGLGCCWGHGKSGNSSADE